MSRTKQEGEPDVFTALAHPIRRQILDELADGERKASSLAAPHAVSRPAVSQHLKILLDAGLVKEKRVGRIRLYSLEPLKLAEAHAWIKRYEKFWTGRLIGLGKHLEENP